MAICTLAIIVITELRGIITILVSLADPPPTAPKPNGGGSAGVIMVVQ
ncbi:MAG: hypothetical protein M3250_04965 [Thermoproteota archaeon]|nr:hypothetical protein [Thermoproteota archaeon]